MRLVLTGTCVSLLLLAAGCGGGDSTSYSSARVRDCVDDTAGIEVTAERQDLDAVMEDAEAGAFKVTVDGEDVSLAFSETEGDARRMAATLEVFATAFNAPVDDILERRGNLVILWENTPTDEQRDALGGCL